MDPIPPQVMKALIYLLVVFSFMNDIHKHMIMLILVVLILVLLELTPWLPSKFYSGFVSTIY